MRRWNGWGDDGHDEALSPAVQAFLAERIGLGTVSSEPGTLPLTKIAYVDALIETTRIDLLIATTRFSQAELLIAEEVRRAKAANRASRLVGLALASAQIAVRSGQQALAVRHVTRAVILAAKRGIVRPFNEQSETLAAVVADTKLAAWGFATHEERKFFVDRCRRLSFSDQAVYENLLSLSQDEPCMTEKLTSREAELLGYIDSGFSNQQIADRVDVSVATIKWHLRNLYTKLGVKNRSAAVARVSHPRARTRPRVSENQQFSFCLAWGRSLTCRWVESPTPRGARDPANWQTGGLPHDGLPK